MPDIAELPADHLFGGLGEQTQNADNPHSELLLEL
jgi:hypothetical protein